MTHNPALVKSLIDVVAEERIAEFEMREGSQSIRILRRASPILSIGGWPQATEQMQAVEASQPKTAAAPVSTVASAHHKVTAPMSGTFYRSTSPGGAPLANVGASVQTGQVVCVIEAMKILNDVASNVAGLVDEVFFQDGEPVEQGQALFSIRGANDVQ